MNAINYQRRLDKLTDELVKENIRPRLLLHSCCAVCSSYCLVYLSVFFDISILYYNPNIFPKEEYLKRLSEVRRLLGIYRDERDLDIELIEAEYDHSVFKSFTEGLEDLPENSERCHKCYELRLREAAKYAKEGGYDYFASTLSISPYKKSRIINEIGERIAKEVGVRHLPNDFKKNGGYDMARELAERYELYRQNYCGCTPYIPE